ncbi:hypothetical protein CFK38_03690 [Brachybacterium vulturis]|uniref:Putative zinc-finger domain-containing protein n=1 Tax=Brachybacterium vulturis TaxID=2017484 RepID=A0A291GKH2_9MICO|nr:zf-HC2 domain-containing protein [Brachybacterium vulturis]ATG50721.1 hypothetical protein CFK38_03690 [Brachybacterium vulturis]
MSGGDHARFADWDGAYVLGALTPADRHAYEDHLETCSRCRDAVAELAPVPGLLAQIRPEPEAVDGTEPAPGAPAPPEVGGATVPSPPGGRSAGPRPHRHRRVLLGALAAAAALLLVLTLPLALGGRQEEPALTVSPSAAGPGPSVMRVDVELAPRDWGTALTITCEYPSASPSGPGRYGGGAPPPSYALVVTAEDATRSEVSSWQGTPGEVVTLEAGTAVELADIAEVSVIDGAGTTVLTAEVDAP